MTGAPRFRSYVVLGFASFALAVVVLVVGSPGMAGFAAVLFAVAALGAGLARKVSWGLVASLVVGVLLQVMMFWLVFGLLAVTSVVEFVAGILGELGLLTVVVASIRGLRHRTEDVPFGDAQRKIVMRTGVVVGVLALVSLVLTIVSRETVSDAERAGTTPVAMRNDKFVPKDLPVTAGQPVRFLVHNHDRIAHTFTQKSLKVDKVIGPGSEAVVELTVPTAGRLEYVCTFHSEMKGTLVAT